MMKRNLLNHYLALACKGDADASFKAGKLMEDIGTYNEVIIQKRYRDAAYAGHASAQKELAGLGLYGTLVTDDSTVTNITYCDNLNNAFMWLHKAANNGNAECTIALEAIGKLGTSVIDNARNAVSYYVKTSYSSSVKKSIADYMLFEIAMQYISPFGVNEYSERKTS